MSRGSPSLFPAPYYLDELARKHEGSPHDDSKSRILSVEHGGRSWRLIVWKYTHPFRVLKSPLGGDPLCLLGEQLDRSDEDGRMIEGGEDLVMVARQHAEQENTYWLAVCHGLHEPTLARPAVDGHPIKVAGP